ncbi:cytochrome c oxidase subunit 4 [Skermania piniformis]|uniref:Cytochrome c oxidase polypeptide 4 n=1 Tax=Skermania pinensis TaxID=39122 RepID=A0ABX8SB09_9ACTN|nr:cytochrome c oxidase subunit 4 [Skermania piniformis]QXQ15053.1 cytochrome c oxidase subunit 4 [Skermania piniformis]
MKIEARLFELLTAFIVIVAIIYAFFTGMSRTGVEWAGTTALVLTGGLTFIVGTYFRFVARRIDLRPEDYEDAEVVDGAGDLGFFSPGSFWPVTLAAAAALTALGLAFFEPWLIALGVCTVLFAAGGLVFEYYLGPEKH